MEGVTGMDNDRTPPPANRADELDQAARFRLERDWRLTMSERLARVHHLSKQMTSIAGATRRK